MDKNKHTPGPWVLDGYRIYGPPDARSKHRNGRALIGGVVDDAIEWRDGPLAVGERPEFQAESTANARLMAAAPELFAELDSAARTCHALNKGYCSGSFEDCRQPRCRDYRTALAKARGES